MRASDSDSDVAASVSPSSRKPRSRSTTRRSPSSPLAVSVSMPAFSKHGTTSSHPAASANTQQPKREYRGKCLYQSRKCENERALKRNGKAHNLCDEHRSKQNQHQRKFDAKKFSRKKRRDSNVKSGDDDDDDDEHEDMKADVDASKDDGTPLPLQQPHNTHQHVETQSVRAAVPPRKRRRVTDEKATSETYTRGGSPQDFHVSGYHQPRATIQPPMISDPRTAPGSGWRPPFAVVDLQPPPQLQHPYGQQPIHRRAPYSPGYTNHQQQPQYDRPSAVGLGERLTMSRPPAPLRPLAAVTRSSPPSSRIQVSQLLHSEGDVPGPPQHRQHHGHVPGTASYSPGPQYGRHPEDISLQHQRQTQSYPVRQHEYSRYPEASARPSVALPPNSSGFDARVSPKYTHSELIAATVLVPAGTVPTSSAGGRHTATPRGVPAMPHPTSYAISPHHARPSTYEHQADKQQQYYLRAQQQTQHHHQQQYPAEDERNRARTSRAESHLPGPPREGGSPSVRYHASYGNPQRPSSTHTSPPTAPPASFSALPGPRKLPSLAPPQFSQPPSHHAASSMTHRSPGLSGVPPHQSQQHPHARHPHPSSSPRQILPSLAPFRQARGSSGARPAFQTPTSSA